jgi:hypothetical protein
VIYQGSCANTEPTQACTRWRANYQIGSTSGRASPSKAASCSSMTQVNVSRVSWAANRAVTKNDAIRTRPATSAGGRSTNDDSSGPDRRVEGPRDLTLPREANPLREVLCPPDRCLPAQVTGQDIDTLVTRISEDQAPVSRRRAHEPSQHLLEVLTPASQARLRLMRREINHRLLSLGFNLDSGYICV